MIRVGAATGMREGEIFGLRWGDVDLKACMIHVRRQYTHGAFVEFPKTEAGARSIGIDAKLAAELAEWKVAQGAEHRNAETLVVASREGGLISASNFLSSEFYPGLTAAGLPRVVFHSSLPPGPKGVDPTPESGSTPKKKGET